MNRKSRVRAISSFIVLAFLPVLLAADHREAPLIREDLVADINDVYAFLSPTDPDRLVLAMTVNPFSVPSENVTYNFSPNVRYVFNIDSDGDAVADAKVMTSFQNQPGGQTFSVELLDGNVVTGDVTAPTEEPDPNPPVIVEEGDVQAFAGQRDDPFFFDVVGFARFLAGTGGFDGTDGFAGVNVSAIVVELAIDLALLNEDDEGDEGDEGDDMGQDSAVALQIWGSTERRKVTIRRGSTGKLQKEVGPFEQIERMGNPAINTALIPAGQQDLFNIGQPQDDATDFAGAIVTSLMALGTDATNIDILASVAVPDTLKLDPAMPIGYPNGRAPADDVIDVLLFFIFNQTPVSDMVDANDRPFLDQFPYLAAPHQPR